MIKPFFQLILKAKLILTIVTEILLEFHSKDAANLRMEVSNSQEYFVNETIYEICE